MANELVGESKITLNGVEYVLRPNFKALVLIEELTKSTLIEIFQRIADTRMTMTDLAAIIYACAKSAAPDSFKLSFEDVGDLVQYEGMSAVGAIATDLIAYAIRGGKEREKDNQKKKDETPNPSNPVSA